MIKIEDFKNAPVGATATNALGSRAMKMNDGMRGWITPKDSYLSDKGMMIFGYVLKPPAPTTAREALDLAWELAHEVKEGQVIPEGARFMELSNFGLKEYTAHVDREINFAIAPATRTFDPLPDPEPDWINAPAVIALVDGWMSGSNPQVFTRYDNEAAPSDWLYNGSERPFRWQDLTDVVPLYPKEGQNA